MGVIFGMLLFISVVMGAYNYAKWEIETTPNPLIAECEKSLPRDRHCVLIAIEENKE